MNKIILALGCSVVLCSFTSQAAVELAKWTFENSSLPAIGTTITGTDYSYGVADSGALVAGSSASGHHASSSTAWTSPVGNGSLKSFSANTWTGGTSGDYWQFTVSTVGYSSIKLSWDQASSNTGPRDYGLYYSTDGSTFTSIGDYIVLANASPNPTWSSGTPRPEFSYSEDLSSITVLNNATLVYFRLVDESTISANGGTVATGGTDRVDNFTVSGAVVPEPSTWLAGALLALPFGVHGVRYLRNRKRA